MSLDLTSVRNAAASLTEALRACEAASEALTDELRELMRDGVIQRFEYTFELCWKFMRRVLRAEGMDGVEAMTNKELFRLAAERGLIEDAGPWIDMLHQRNLTPHTCDEATARAVLEAVRGFESEIEYFIVQLERRVADEPVR